MPPFKEFISRNNGRTVNLYIGRDRDGKEVLRRAFGLRTVYDHGSAVRVRGFLELNNYVFAGVGDRIIQLDSGYNVIANVGSIGNDNRKVRFAASPDTLMTTSAGQMFRLNGGALTNLSTSIPLGFTPISMDFLDNYFAALADDLRQFYFDDTDGATWDAGDVQTAEADANRFVASIVDHETLFIYGNRITQAFIVGRNVNRPFEAQKNGVLPFGIEAADSLIGCAGYRFWVGQNREGRASVYKGQGYDAQRVSTEHVEAAIRNYGDISDAVAWAIELEGHPRVRFSFPSALNGTGATWEYDITENSWSETLWWNSGSAEFEAHRGFCAVSAFGKILIGDRDNGKIYEMSSDFYDDDLANGGERIHWKRQAPRIRSNHRIEFPSFYILCKTGVGDGSNRDPLLGTVTEEADPVIAMQYSNDDGESFSNELYRSMGAQGEKKPSLLWTRQGMDYDRIYDVSGQAAVDLEINEAGFDGDLQELRG